MLENLGFEVGFIGAPRGNLEIANLLVEQALDRENGYDSSV